MGDIFNITNLIISIIVGLFSIIGGIVGAILFVNKSIKNKITTAIDGLTANIDSKLTNQSTLQNSVDQLCAQDREGLDSSLQTLVGKHVLLETELRSPNTGVYVRLKEVETAVKYIEKDVESAVNSIVREIESIKKEVKGG